MLWRKSLACSFFFSVLRFIPEREWQHCSSSQLLVPHRFLFLVFINLEFEFISRDHAISIPVLVFKHVNDNLLHGQSRLNTASALCHLQLNVLPELKMWTNKRKIFGTKNTAGNLLVIVTTSYDHMIFTDFINDNPTSGVILGLNTRWRQRYVNVTFLWVKAETCRFYCRYNL